MINNRTSGFSACVFRLSVPAHPKGRLGNFRKKLAANHPVFEFSERFQCKFTDKLRILGINPARALDLNSKNKICNMQPRGNREATERNREATETGAPHWQPLLCRALGLEKLFHTVL